MRIFIFCTIAFLFLPTILFAQKKEKKGTKQQKKGLEGLSVTGLPLFAYNDDLGLLYGGRVVATHHEGDRKPYHYRFWLQHLESSLRYTDYAAYFDYITHSRFRGRVRIGRKRNILARYYGYGNIQDIRRIRRVTGDQKPVLPVGPNLYRTQIDINFDRERLKDSQNRYYNYHYESSYLDGSVEDWLQDSNFKYFVGFLGQRYTLHSYHGKLESGEIERNILGYVDIEQPEGYDAVREPGRKYVNYLRTALIYDTRPPEQENNPSRGIFADIHYERAMEGLGSDYEYGNTTLTWRQYVNVFPTFWDPLGMQSVFAYRFIFRQTSGGTAPFFEAGKIRNVRETIEGLGGKDGLRAFPSNQFIDRFISLANFEIRHTYLKTQALGGLDFHLLYFYDIGRVAPSSSEWEIRDFHKAYGFGLGATLEQSLTAQALFGYSKFHSYTSLNLRYTF